MSVQCAAKAHVPDRDITRSAYEHCSAAAMKPMNRLLPNSVGMPSVVGALGPERCENIQRRLLRPRMARFNTGNQAGTEIIQCAQLAPHLLPDAPKMSKAEVRWASRA